jgi:hypothetical protein
VIAAWPLVYVLLTTTVTKDVVGLALTVLLTREVERDPRPQVLSQEEAREWLDTARSIPGVTDQDIERALLDNYPEPGKWDRRWLAWDRFVIDAAPFMSVLAAVAFALSLVEQNWWATTPAALLGASWVWLWNRHDKDGRWRRRRRRAVAVVRRAGARLTVQPEAGGPR